MIYEGAACSTWKMPKKVRGAKISVNPAWHLAVRRCRFGEDRKFLSEPLKLYLPKGVCYHNHGIQLIRSRLLLPVES